MVDGSGGWGKIPFSTAGYSNSSQTHERERERPMVPRSTETCTCTGRPMVAGLRWLRGVQRLIPALGDLWLQGCGGCEEYSDLYLHWETIGCRVAVVARSTETCTRSDLWLQGLRWLRRVQRRIPALG